MSNQTPDVFVEPRSAHDRIVLPILIGAILVTPTLGAIPLFEGIQCGLNCTKAIRAELGAPVRALAFATYIERFRCPAHGITTADVGYEDHGPVRWARIRFVKKMSPQAMAIVFWQTDPPRLQEEGSKIQIHHYDRHGVHMRVKDEIVIEVWMTLPDADWDRVLTEATPLLPALDLQPETEPTPAS